MKFSAAVILAGCSLAVPASAATPKTCLTGSVAVTTVQLTVQPPTGAPKPIPQVNILKQGYKILYKPVNLPADIRKEARVTLVMAPAEGEPTGTAALTVLDSAPAGAPAEWTLPVRASIVMFVFAPQGLDEKKVANFVAREEDTINQLAGYADRTAELESMFKELTALDDDADDDGDPRLGGTPVEQALLALLRAQNPSLASYNPLAAGRRAAPANNVGKATDAFFSNAGSIVPGGGVLPEVKSFFFPDTELRSTFALQTDGGMMLCGQRRPPRGRTKYAFLWAHRAIDAAAPQPTVQDLHIPAKLRSPLSMKLASAAQWESLDHVRDWALTPASGSGAAVPVPVTIAANVRSVVLDLRKAPVEPGQYRLSGKWDWDDVAVAGTIDVHAVPDLSATKLDPASQDKLIEGAGIIPVRIQGPDFQFVEKITLQTLNAAPLEFRLAKGRRGGVQPALDTEIDVGDMRPGTYNLVLTQSGGAQTTVGFRVLPVPPKLESLPLKLTVGEGQQTVTLRGAGLDRIQRIESDGADIELGAPVPGAATRDAIFRLKGQSKAGDRIPLSLRVEGMQQVAKIDGALSIAGPRPKLALSKTSLPTDAPTALRNGELPSGSWTGFLFQIENATPDTTLDFRCAGAKRTLSLALGTRVPNASLDHTAPGRWFAAVDPSAIGGTGCAAEAVAVSESGVSDAVKLGTVVRLPVVESATMVGDRVELKGRDLDAIERVGWSAEGPIAIDALPVALAGQGPRQVLRTALIAPLDLTLPLHVWLWGEKEPRGTRVPLTNAPAAAPAK